MKQSKKIINIWKNSFKLNMTFIYVLLYDLLFFAVIIPCTWLFLLILNKKAAALNTFGGDLKNYLGTASPEQIAFLSSNMKSLLLLFFIGLIIILLIALFSYTLSRSLIWNKLANKKFQFKKYAKFLLLNLIIFIALIIFGFIYLLLIRISPLIFTIIFYFIAVLIFYLLFLTKLSYAETGKIFGSVAKAFERFNKTVYLLSLCAFAVLAVISFALNLILGTRQFANMGVTLILLLIFWSWLRIFVAKVK